MELEPKQKLVSYESNETSADIFEYFTVQVYVTARQICRVKAEPVIDISDEVLISVQCQ